MAGAYHGWATLHELELLVKCGFTPAQALTAATKISAAALGVLSDRGTIEPGKLADLLLVKGNPDEDILAIGNTQLVFFGGKEFDPRALEKAIASPELTPLPSHEIAAKVDDMERPGKRTALDTLRIGPAISKTRERRSFAPQGAFASALRLNSANGIRTVFHAPAPL
jgi:adenine deaminase